MYSLHEHLLDYNGIHNTWTVICALHSELLITLFFFENAHILEIRYEYELWADFSGTDSSIECPDLLASDHLKLALSLLA
jgi:sucrose-6-phosphate hydrolase SacC (GH32 family)